MITHLACIMDGNRRWAKKNGLAKWHGHKEGIKAVQRALQFCLENQIPHLSLYTFSLENLRRSDQEKSFLFDLFARELLQQTDTLTERSVRLQFVGDRNLFPDHIKQLCTQIEEKTASGTALTVYLLFCYGGQQEILAGIKGALADLQANRLDTSQLADQFKNYLWLGNTPTPDLIIRTGGVRRLSNFLLYHAAYSELYFLDELWPEMEMGDFQKALDYFNNCQRNFGV